MNVKLIAAAIATLGLVACTPDITPQAGAGPSGPAISSTPAQPGAEQQLVQAPQAVAAPDTQEERKDDGAAPAPAVEAKTDEGGK